MLNVALVGLGEIARSAHLPALERNDEMRLVAVADSSPSQRDAVAQSLEPGVAVLKSLDDVLAGDDLDAVIFATPPWATPELVLTAAKHGLYVLAEKPVATSVAASAVYQSLTDTERSRVQIGLTYRHDPAMIALREVITTGELGGPLLVRAHIYDEQRTADISHSSLIERTLEHGSPVVHEGAHVFDWLKYLLGGDAEVSDAWAVQTRERLATPNLVGARLTYPRGSLALVEFGWLTDALPRSELSFLGDKAYAVLDGRTFQLTITSREGVRTVEFPGDRVSRCFDLQLKRFAELAKGTRSQPVPNLDDGLHALTISQRVAECAIASTMTVGEARS